VPVLWDKAQGVIVNNESSEIIRMLNSAFDGVGATPSDYYPAEPRDEIDALNERIYATVNNGVYRAGFATTQEAYEEAVGPLFETLDWLETRLHDRPYLCGERLTEARLAAVHDAGAVRSSPLSGLMGWVVGCCCGGLSRPEAGHDQEVPGDPHPCRTRGA